MKRSTIAILVIILAVIGVISASYNSGVAIRISSINNVQNTSSGTFEIFFSTEVWNQLPFSVAVNHPSSCGFTATILVDQFNSNYTYTSSQMCTNAVTKHSYKPGLTFSDRSIDLGFDNYTGENLPDGNYTLTFSSNKRLPIIYSAYIIVQNGAVSFSYDSIPQNWGDTPLLPLFMVILIMTPISIVSYLGYKYYAKHNLEKK